MYKLIRTITTSRYLKKIELDPSVRTFLSQAYYCQEVWAHRLNTPLLQKVNLDELYHDLDQRFQKTRQISAVDVDIFANAVSTDVFIDELMDLIHKLRLSSETGSTLNSTSHAVVRALKDFGKTSELLNALDDRLNYGMFLDYYTANILFDHFWKVKDFTSGARVASQLMLQEEFSHTLSLNLGLLHCYQYLLKPAGWPEMPQPQPEDPEEEVKVRVNYLRNPYDDEHFDLRDPNRIVGKTLAWFTNKKDDSLSKSLNILGWVLFGKNDLALETIKDCAKNNTAVYKEVLDLLPEDSEVKKELNILKVLTANVQELLIEQVKLAERNCSEKDIAEQCNIYSKWESGRTEALEEQKKRFLTSRRLAEIEDLKKGLKEKETKLWFFENEEKIELDIEAKRIYYPKKWFGHKKKPRKVDEGYVPPEV